MNLDGVTMADEPLIQALERIKELEEQLAESQQAVVKLALSQNTGSNPPGGAKRKRSDKDYESADDKSEDDEPLIQAIETDPVKECAKAIGKMSKEQVSKVYGLLKAREDRMSLAATLNFQIGDRVQFDAGSKKGGILCGVVSKVNQKTLKIKQNDSRTIWTVTATNVSMQQE